MIIDTLPGTNIVYTEEHDRMTPAQIWEAWKRCELTVFHMLTWEARHGMYFDEDGTPHEE